MDKGEIIRKLELSIKRTSTLLRSIATLSIEPERKDCWLEVGIDAGRCDQANCDLASLLNELKKDK